MALANQTGSTSSSDSDEDFVFADLVYMALLNQDDTQVLMMQSEGQWSLPRYVYPESLNAKVDICCQDFQREVGVDSTETCFTTVVEILGTFAAGGESKDDPLPAYLQLMLVESHVEGLELPEHMEWKDADFVSHLLDGIVGKDGVRDKHVVLQAVLDILQASTRSDERFQDPRYKYKWFDKASQWLRNVVKDEGHTPDGRVIQVMMSPTSTILKVNSTGGWFYLKAPALGSKESQITCTVTSIFPTSTPEVLQTRADWNAFISRGFGEKKLKKKHSALVLMSMAKMQKESIKHIGALKDGGCDIRGPDELAMKIEEWKDENVVKRAFGGRFEDFESCASELVEMCKELATYNLPLCLVHGDLMPHNAAPKGKPGDGVILFDWQYACISHPFFDLHDIFEDIDERAVEEYLSQWTDFVESDKAVEALQLARRLGWCLKMWTLFDCMKVSDPQRNSCFGEYAVDFFYCVQSEIRREEESEEDTSDDNEKERP